ncbi:unnamed protein product [Durusdinium trenchii]|uniref:Homing endonuclease LAGLIDADG domain-containing protein n=1 Tax=Durusdinium trenchii TaxID=1381693 RepID=A0ABP0M7P6_9DINO
MEKSHGVIHMKICQSLDSAAVLMRFRDFLGGGIYRHSDRTGTKEATLQWKVHGTTMQHAADVLCKFPSMQRAQLQIAAGGAVARADRSDMIQTLKQLKQMDHVPTTFQSSWPYFAGFFDAEGSITVGGTYVGLHLQVHQKNPFVLEELHSFLLKHKLNKWALHSDNSRGAWKLQCRHRATCQLTLRHLLDSGLDLKKRQADLALSLTADNQMQVREAMFELNGNQNKYGRLDGPGIQRAKEISSVRQQLKKASQQERELLEVKLEGLLEEHKLQNLVTKSLPQMQLSCTTTMHETRGLRARYFATGLMVLYIVYNLLASQTFQGRLPMFLVVVSFISWVVTPVIFAPLPRCELIEQDLREFNGFINGRAGMSEKELPEVVERGQRGRARTIFECGLVDSVSYWTKMCQSPEGQMGQRSMRRKNMGTPMVLGQSRPAWRFRYDFQLLFLYIFGWF